MILQFNRPCELCLLDVVQAGLVRETWRLFSVYELPNTRASNSPLRRTKANNLTQLSRMQKFNDCIILQRRGLGTAPFFVTYGASGRFHGLGWLARSSTGSVQKKEDEANAVPLVHSFHFPGDPEKDVQLALFHKRSAVVASTREADGSS